MSEYVKDNLEDVDIEELLQDYELAQYLDESLTLEEASSLSTQISDIDKKLNESTNEQNEGAFFQTPISTRPASRGKNMDLLRKFYYEGDSLNTHDDVTIDNKQSEEVFDILVEPGEMQIVENDEPYYLQTIDEEERWKLFYE